MMGADETHGRFELTACVMGAAERRVHIGRLGHLGIRIREATEAVEVEPPAMIPGCRQLIAPGDPVEAVGDRQSQRKSSSMDVKRDFFADPESRNAGR